MPDCYCAVMLANLVPAPLVRVFAGPYVAGDDMKTALDAAGVLLATRGLVSTLDLLGEDVTEAGQVEQNEQVYSRLIRAIDKDPRFVDPAARPSVSVKPSAFSVDEDKSLAFAPIYRLAVEAQAHKVRFTIDMEDHKWTDITLKKSVAYFKEGLDVGTVIQTRLNRTQEDLQMIPSGMRVRLVIGIYPESADIATTDKEVMKSRMLDAAKTLMARGVYVEFGTHDEPYIERFVKEIAAEYPELAEVQMLLGVPRRALQDRIVSGELGPVVPVRVYVPFAMGWDDATAYLRRRMAESPSMVFLVLRNLFSRDR